MSVFRIHPQASFNFGEMVVDNFAGGGGASTGIEAALGRPVDVAINHDLAAIEMHEVNHPHTVHLCESVWDVDPAALCAGRRVGLAWFSPDCKHFSKAKGGKPVEKKIRGLAWVAVKWAKVVKPRVIILENVEEFQTWGPLTDDNRPCPVRKGETFRQWKAALERLGYRVEYRELRACDYGAPTIRKRLFVVARCDGLPIVWPEPTHGDPKSEAVRSGLLKPWRTAAECIDWSLPCPSIFERARPLADATLRRIARGVMRYVVNAAEPFIVPIAHYNGTSPAHSLREPLRTVTAWPKGGHFALVAPVVSTYYGEKSDRDDRCARVDRPVATQTTENRHALVSAFLAKHYGGVTGSAMAAPIGTVTSIDHHSLVASHLIKLRGTCRDGQAVNAPAPTVTAGGNHVGEVRAFLLKYYGTDQDPQLRDPLHTVTTKDRFGLVTVKGELYRLADIGLRMLAPRELFAAQGFPADYIIDQTKDGKLISKADQVARCGNSVPPAFAEALVRANVVEQRAVA